MTTSTTASRTRTLYAGLALVGLTCLALSDQLEGLKSFQGGQTAKAAEVNHNFQAIASVLNGNLSGGNLQPDSITSRELASQSVGYNQIAEHAIWSNKLTNWIDLGYSGGDGRLDIRTDYLEDKISARISCAGDEGGSIWIMQRGKGDGDSAVYLGVPSCSSSDGGLVNVYDGNGNVAVQLNGSGTIYKTGNNGFVHPHPLDPMRQIVYMSLEGGERGTYFRGAGRLVGGQATIIPPQDWQLVSSRQGITVQVTPHAPIGGLYVAEATRERIVVRSADGADAAFDYLVNGLRDGFEDHAVVEPNTMFLPTKPVWHGPLDSGIAPALVRNGILLPDGSIDHNLVDVVRQANREQIAAPERVADLGND